MLGLDCYTLTMDDEVTFQAVEAISRFHLRKERTDTHSSNRELFVWIICPKGDCQTPGHLRRLWNASSPDNLDSPPHSPFGQVLACTFLSPICLINWSIQELLPNHFTNGISDSGPGLLDHWNYLLVSLLFWMNFQRFSKTTVDLVLPKNVANVQQKLYICLFYTLDFGQI